MSLIDSYVLRPLRAADVARIFSDWLQSYHSATEVRKIPNPVYYHWHHKILESLMVDPMVAWQVAVDPANPDLIAGWACYQHFQGGAALVHYVYVARTFRRLGLASRLLATAGVPRDQGVMVTATTHAGNQLLVSRGNEAVYNPYLLFGRAPMPPISTEVRKDIADAIKASAKAHKAGYNLQERPEERT
jgi:GNAT superfamily N-acetyltransferase